VQTVAERSASTPQQEHVSNVAWLLAVAVRECVCVRVCNEAVMLDQGGGDCLGEREGRAAHAPLSAAIETATARIVFIMAGLGKIVH